MHIRRGAADDELGLEFAGLQEEHNLQVAESSFAAAIKRSNDEKNRYIDILPYDQTRVVLQGTPGGDYINAVRAGSGFGGGFFFFF